MHINLFFETHKIKSTLFSVEECVAEVNYRGTRFTSFWIFEGVYLIRNDNVHFPTYSEMYNVSTLDLFYRSSL